MDIEQWLTKRNQRVTLENHVSSGIYKLPVKSGISQGTVLGPFMFWSPWTDHLYSYIAMPGSCIYAVDKSLVLLHDSPN